MSRLEFPLGRAPGFGGDSALLSIPISGSEKGLGPPKWFEPWHFSLLITADSVLTGKVWVTEGEPAASGVERLCSNAVRDPAIGLV